MMTLQTSNPYPYTAKPVARPARAARPVLTDAQLLATMLETVEAFLATERDLAGTLSALAKHCWQLTTVSPKWQQVFLNVWKSVELVQTEVSAHDRAMCEMELRFVLALVRQLRDLLLDARRQISESAAD